MNILVSYHYWKDRIGSDWSAWLRLYFGDDPARHPEQVFVDSGGFTARTMGVEIDPLVYGQWLVEHKDDLTVAANLDVIRDPVASDTNQRIIESTGAKVIPVFHSGTPWKVLERYCEEHPYVALGGMVSETQDRKNKMRFLVRCHQIAARYGATLHGFGATGWDVVLDFPWQSVDSSSWTVGQRYGWLHVWTGRRMKIVKLQDRHEIVANASHIRHLGFDPKVFLDDDLHYRWITGLCGMSWLRMSEALRQHRPDFTLYLADVTPASFHYLWQAATTVEDTGVATIDYWSPTDVNTQ